MNKTLLPVVVSVLALFTLTACGPPLASEIHYASALEKYPNIVKQNTAENYDDFKKQTWITGPRLGKSGQYRYLRALADKNKSIGFIQLYLYHFEWDNDGYDFHSAYDPSGKKLEFHKVRYEKDWQEYHIGEGQTEYRQCSIDDAAVTISYKELVKLRNSGLTVKLYGRLGNKVVELPAVYVNDFLSVLEERYNLKGLK